MKNLKLLAIWSILLTACTSAWSQFRLDIIAGISPGSNPTTAGIFVNRQSPAEEFTLNMYKVKPQFYGGLITHLDLSTPFFTEVGAIYTRKSSMYFMEYTLDLESGRVPSASMSETEHLILIPASIGVSLGSFDVTSGFTAIGTLSKETELSHLKGFQSDSPFIQWGWHTGVRHTIRRSMIGIEYQGSFNRVGQGAFVNGQSLELMNVPGQFVMTFQFSF